jgi:hypothetical protein
MTRQYLRAILAGLLLGVLASPLAEIMSGQQVEADGRQCDVAPRSYANIASLLETPLATPSATTNGETLETGTPATNAERGSMRSLVEGKLFSAWALFSDPYLYRLISRQSPITEALYDDWSTPQPEGSVTATLLEISGERRLDDGRLGATVRIRYASVPMPKQFFFYFVEHDNSLLIDSILGEISFSVP